MKKSPFFILVVALFFSCQEKRLTSIENRLDELNTMISPVDLEKLDIADICKEMELEVNEIKIGEADSQFISIGDSSYRINYKCFYIRNDTSAFYIIIDVLNNSGDHIYAKFIPVPHHTLTVIDDPDIRSDNIAGILEVLDKKKGFNKLKHFRYPDLHKGTLVACVDIPKRDSKKYNILVVPPQSKEHKENEHPVELHTSRHPVDDPRG